MSGIRYTFAGRLQKPVNFITTNDPRVKFLNQYNLKNAMTIAIFLIDGEGNSRQATFNERQLYEQITKLSYLGISECILEEKI